MAISTEETVRAVIVAAVRAIAVTDLGFDAAEGNIHEHLLEWEHPDRVADYLFAKVNGRLQVQAWAFEVLGDDPWFASGNITNRTYQIAIVGYGPIGVDGEGWNEMIRQARKVRNAIRLLSQRLSETVDYVESVSNLSGRIVTGYDSVDPFIEGRMNYVAKRKNPDF